MKEGGLVVSNQYLQMLERGSADQQIETNVDLQENGVINETEREWKQDTLLTNLDGTKAEVQM